MKFYAEYRLRGDIYNEGYGNGMTLAGSSSVRESEILSEDDNRTVFSSPAGLKVNCIHERKGDVFECKTIASNEGNEDLVLELLSSFALKEINADKMHRACSFWSAEGKLLSQELTELDMERSWAYHGLRIEKFGQIGSLPVRKYFPFIVLEDQERSEFVGIQLYCASSWQIEVLRNDDTVTVQGGIADRDYGSWTKILKPGETFETPKAVVATGSSIYDVCDKLVKAQSPRIAKADLDLPVIFNEYCTTWGNPSFEDLVKIADKLEGSGVRYLVMDSGWYKDSNEEAWYLTSGDWEPSKVLFPDGIDKVAKMIKEHNMIPGIWFELETVASRSKAYQMTDMLLKRDGIPVTVGTRRFWDMRDPKVWSYLDEKVIGLLKDNGFGYLKVDYNETIGAGVDGDDSYGEGLRKTVEGTRQYFKHMSEEMPDLVIENCASGGHRLEPSMMELCSQASFSDAHECKSIPLIAANLHRLIQPRQSQIWAVLRKEDDMDRICYTLSSAFLGRLCLSGDIFDLTSEKWDKVKEAISFYDHVKHIIRDGKTTAIKTNVKDYSKPEGYQAVLRVLHNEALLVVHTFENGKNPPLDEMIEGYKIKEEFGSKLDDDFRGRVYLLSR